MRKLDGAIVDPFLPRPPLPVQAATEFQRLSKLIKQLSHVH